MDDFIAFVLAFGQKWTTVMSGAVGLILTGLGFSGSVPASRAFVVAGILCFFWACFLVWRDEHRGAEKLTTDLSARSTELETARAAITAPPKSTAADEHQDSIVQAQVERMNHVLVDALLRIALSGAEAEHINGMKTIGQMTGWFRREGVMLYVQDGWLAPLRRWANQEIARRAAGGQE
jgi:hypothetical protein